MACVSLRDAVHVCSCVYAAPLSVVVVDACLHRSGGVNDRVVASGKSSATSRSAVVMVAHCYDCGVAMR